MMVDKPMNHHFVCRVCGAEHIRILTVKEMLAGCGGLPKGWGCYRTPWGTHEFCPEKRCQDTLDALCKAQGAANAGGA